MHWRVMHACDLTHVCHLPCRVQAPADQPIALLSHLPETSEALAKLRSVRLPDLVLEDPASWKLLSSLPWLAELHLGQLGSLGCLAGGRAALAGTRSRLMALLGCSRRPAGSGGSGSGGSSRSRSRRNSTDSSQGGSVTTGLPAPVEGTSCELSRGASRGSSLDLEEQQADGWVPSGSVRQLQLRALPRGRGAAPLVQAYAEWLARLLPRLECVQCEQVPGMWQLVSVAVRQGQEQQA